jgi:hypothetical protein
MPVSTDILRTYRGPRRVVRGLLDTGPREDRAIMWLMTGCLLAFVSSLPGLQRKAVLADGDFTRDATYTFFALMMVAPLMFYLLAFLGRAGAYVLGGRPGGYGARVALFWSWLAAAPLLLFYGLLAGLNEAAAPATRVIGGLWLLVLLTFWISGLVEASKGKHDLDN